MKNCISVLLCLLCIISMTACTGYNGTMFDHLGNRSNYEPYTVKIVEIVYYDGQRQVTLTDTSDEAFQASDVCFTVVLTDENDRNAFHSSASQADLPLSEFKIRFDLAQANHQLLLNSGFYDDYTLGEPVELCASNWSHMDGFFYYIIGVHYNDTEYLNADDGLENVINEMNENKSLI